MKEDKEYSKIWNDMHIKLINKHTPSKRNDLMADYCETMILKAKDAYYNTGTVIMSDRQYDDFEDKLRILRPTSKVLDKVGA